MTKENVFLKRNMKEDESISFTNATNEIQDVRIISDKIMKQMSSLKEVLAKKLTIIRNIESDYLDKNFKQLAACELEMAYLQLLLSELNQTISQKETVQVKAGEYLLKMYKSRLAKVQKDIDNMSEHSSLELSKLKTIPIEMIHLLVELQFSAHSFPPKINTVTREFKDVSKQFGSIEIRDCAILKNSDIIVSDKTNKRLLLYSRETTFKKDVPFDEMPFSVVGIGSTEVAVSFPNSTCVKFVDVFTNAVIREFTFEGPCTGISIYKGLLAVRVEKSGCHIKDISNGKTYRVVKIDDEFTSYVALRDNSLYFTNWHTDQVVCMTLDGELKWEFKNENLKKPNGIVLDAHGNAFVAGYSSDNIFFVTKDGFNLKQISIKYDTSLDKSTLNERENRNPISLDIINKRELLVCTITGFSISEITIYE